MGRIRNTQVGLIIIAGILLIVALQSYRFKTDGITLKNKMDINKDVTEQLEIDNKQAKGITEYILINNINVDFINLKATEDNGNKVIEIFDTESNCYTVLVDKDYNIVEEH